MVFQIRSKIVQRFIFITRHPATLKPLLVGKRQRKAGKRGCSKRREEQEGRKNEEEREKEDGKEEEEEARSRG